MMLEAYEAGVALLKAVQEGDLDGVEEALSSGADVNSQGIYNFTSLAWASQNGDEHIVDLLLKHDADINHNNNDHQSTALMLASFEGKLSIVKMLVEHGADLNMTNRYKCTAVAGGKETTADIFHYDLFSLYQRLR